MGFLHVSNSQTKKSIGVRLGRGKGIINTWASKIPTGYNLFFLISKHILNLIKILYITFKRLPININISKIKNFIQNEYFYNNRLKIINFFDKSNSINLN